MLKKIIQFKLKVLARMIIAKYQPKIIGITGSVGKTSAKEAVLCVVGSKFRVRGSRKNYNNEYGLPLSIIGADSPGRDIFGWFNVFALALGLLIFRSKDYPEVLVLEMGVDKKGDMDYLNSIVACDIGVVTVIGHSHLENFGSIEEIKREKSKLISNLNKGGYAVLNYDDIRTREMAKNSKVRVLQYGFTEGADLQASNLVFKFEETGNAASLSGSAFKVEYHGSMAPVILPEVIGTASAYAALAAVGVGLAMEMNLIEISSALRGFVSPKGRMKLVEGIKKTMIIDDTYNASPQSSLAAIDFIGRIKTEESFRKVAVFGDMLELGAYSEEGHREVGRALAKAGFDLLVTAGERARDIGRGAVEAGLKEEQVFNFPDNSEAGRFVQDRLKSGDLILVKGSQGARMEKVVKELMADPLSAPAVLVRQEKEWEDRK